MVVKLKGTLLLLLICLPQYLSAQYTGGNSDGYSNNTLTQGACLPFSNDFMFYGSSGDGYSNNTLTQGACLSFSNDFMFYGSSGDGYNNNTLTQGACLSFSNDYMFYGSSGDGYNNNTLTQGACLSFSNDYMFYGSSGDGYNINTLTQGSCLPFSNDFIYYGASGDGYNNNTLTQGACLPFSNDFIYYGASGDGYNNNTLTQGACLPFSNDFMFYGGIKDGFGLSIIEQTRCTNITILPIELLSVAGFCESNNIAIRWVTATETNNDYFTIERSSDGYNFNILGTKDGAGNSFQILNYLFIDSAPLKGTSYYRLKQTDLDGHFIYSDLITVNCDNKLGSDLFVYPNPGSNELILESENVIYRDLGFIIIDSKGQLIKQGTFNNKIKIQTVDFSQGIYLIRFENGTGIKWIKQ